MTQIVRTRFSQIAVSALVSLGAGLTLSACSPQGYHGGSSVNANPISISESIERLELYSRPNGMSLASRDQAAVAEFLNAYALHGDGPLYMNVPAAQSGMIGTRQSANLIRQTMSQLGMGVGALQTGQYQTNPAAPAPVVVSYRRLKIIPKDCRSGADLMSTHSNRPGPSFGCSFNANLGAMIQDPRQLLEPYSMGPPDAQRRQAVYDKFILGENPASEQPDRQENRTEDN
jgi:pilus assembly protein CpaD